MDENILGLGFEYLKEVMEKKNLPGSEVDYFLPHISSHYFEDKIANNLVTYNIDITKDKWFLNLSTMGNVGAASIYLMLLNRNNMFQRMKSLKLYKYRI